MTPPSPRGARVSGQATGAALVAWALRVLA